MDQIRAFAVCPKMIDRCGEDTSLRAVLYAFLVRTDLQFCIDNDEAAIKLYHEVIRNAGSDKQYRLHEWLNLMVNRRGKSWLYRLPVKYDGKGHAKFFFSLAVASERGKVVVAASQSHYKKHAASNGDVRVIEGCDFASEIGLASDIPAPLPQPRKPSGFAERQETFPTPQHMFIFKKGAIMAAEIKGGDTITGNVNSTIVNRAKVEGYINNLGGAGGGADQQAVLKQVLALVEASGNREAGDLLESFSKEAADKKPKKTVLNALWLGLKEAVPSIKDAVGLAAEVQKLFLS